MPLDVVGRPTPRVDARERVTGRATYTGDVWLPGMLYARVLRSPFPHARIRRIDVARARALPGVRAILTHETCRVVWSSGDLRNTRYLFNNPVRFVGDPVAAVAAVDRHVAEEALRLIEVDYEELPFVLDPEEALEAGAVEIHPGGNLSPRADGTREPEIYRRGDVKQGFAASDRIFEDRYVSKHLNNAQLEPRVSLAHWDGDRLIVWASTQGISNCQADLARDLQLPPEKVRVICQYMGGGFGNKNQCHDFDLMAAVLAREAGAPVKLELTRKEDFIAVHGRWPTRQYYRVGVKRDGTLQAIQLRGVSGMGPYRKSSGSIAGVELYRCPHVETVIYPVYTNTAVAANFRGPAYPQGVFGIESLMDEIAYALGLDPVEFRLKNLTERYHDEVPYTSNGLAECIRRGAAAFGWTARFHPPGADPGPIKRGVGMAMGMFAARLGRSSALVRLDEDGRLWVHVGVTDIGTAAKTAMALLAAEAMDLPLDRVQVVWGDTDRCPYSVGESGSRTTTHTGQAVLEAIADLKRQIAQHGPPRGGVERVGRATPNPTLDGQARYSFAAHFAEVEVDTELGGVRVTRYVAVHDSGRIINPLAAASQVKGGVTMGLGMALHEELLYDRRTGVPLNAGYYGARVMTHLDAPEIEVIFVETEDPYGPYGAKSVGEPPIIPSVAAVANAVYNAIGVRIKELPITRARILEALA
jgi:CO/xanthine dehydrogenase Mo-binding subunit